MTTYGSVCSGIEAASVAWETLGWKPAWFSQFDPEHNYSRHPDFPSRVLAHHWPDVPNLGDMTKIADLVRWGAIEAPDVLVGGTPCQAFSVAGLRKGLSDPRGQLTISFGELADAIDEQRDKPCTIIWENVPGVLNSKDNAFGCFLALLAGESCELQPPGRKWTNAGCVSGPKRIVAWRVLDAQFFGVAQRRRRVFVVASADPDFDPTAVLFESDSLRRNTPPCRETGEKTTGTLTSRTSAGGGLGDFELNGGLTVARALTANGVGTCGADEQAGHLIAAFGGGNTAGQIDVATTCTAHGNRQDFDTETFCLQHAPIGRADKAGPQGKGYQADIAFTLDASKTADAVVFSSNGHASFSEGVGTLRAKPGADHETVAITYTAPAIGQFKQDDISSTLTKSAGQGNGETQNSAFVVQSQSMSVRRLTPVECERLQGFPDGHTDIPGAKDGPRYKALGNSMAVPVMRWLGRKISPR